MATILTRRDAVPDSSGAQVQRADVAAPKLPIESGASLRVLRPALNLRASEFSDGVASLCV